MRTQSQLVRGILEGCILKIIQRHETYGYEIVETLRTLGFTEINEGTVYPLLLRLEKNQWIQHTKKASPQGPQRKYYTLTPLGAEELSHFLNNWNILQSNVSKILNL